MPSIITDPIFYYMAIPAVILLGLSKGGFAGLGVASTPMLALYLPPLEAAALILPLLMMQDAISVYVYRKDWSAWNLKVMLPGALVGMSLGWLTAAYVSDATVRVIVGTIGLVFVANTWLQRARVEPRPATTLSGVFWGGLSGFTSFMTQAGGPPFQVHILPQRLPKMTMVGTTTIFFAAVNALKIVPYSMLNQFTWKNFATSVLLMPIAVAANFLGIWLVKRTPTGVFYKIVYTLLFIICAALLWQGLRDTLFR